MRLIVSVLEYRGNGKDLQGIKTARVSCNRWLASEMSQVAMSQHNLQLSTGELP